MVYSPNTNRIVDTNYAVMKRDIDRGYRKFWKKRGMQEPKVSQTIIYL